MLVTSMSHHEYMILTWYIVVYFLVTYILRDCDWISCCGPSGCPPLHVLAMWQQCQSLHHSATPISYQICYLLLQLLFTVYPYLALECPPASRFSGRSRIHHFPWLDAGFWLYMASCDILPAQAGWASFSWCSMTRCLCRWQEPSPNPCFSSPDKETHCMYHTHLPLNVQHKFDHWLVLWSKFNTPRLSLSKSDYSYISVFR